MRRCNSIRKSCRPNLEARFWRRHHHWVFEQFEDRTLLSAVPGGTLGLAAPLSAGPDTYSGVLNERAPVYFRVNPTSDALLVAQVSAPGLHTQISLLDGQGHLLVQSNGQFASGSEDVITQHLGAGTDYLEVQSLVGSENYTLTTELTESSEPGTGALKLFGGFHPSSLVTGDFFGDGRIAIAMAGFDTSTGQEELDVLQFKSDGSLQSTTLTSLGNVSVSALATGDFNGDGHSDLALAESDNAAGQNLLGVLLGNADGTFQSTAPINLGSLSVASLVTGDFTGDGHTDIAIAQGSTSVGQSELEVLVGQGNGTFRSTAPTSPGVLLLSLPPSLVSLPIPPIPLGVSSLLTGNFLGDGHTDLAAVVGADLDYELELLHVDADGMLQTTTPTDLGFADPPTVVTGDFLGDGRTQLAVEGFSERAEPAASGGFIAASYTLELMQVSTQGTFQVAATIAPGNGVGYVGLFAADNFTGDGRTELAVTQGDVPGQQDKLALLRINGDGTSQLITSTDLGTLGAPPPTSGLAGPTAVSLLTGDFTGDGRADIAVEGLDSSTQQNQVEVLLAGPGMTLQTAPPINLGGAFLSSLVSGDFTRDGRTDLAVAGFDTASQRYEVAVLPGNGDGTFQAATSTNLGNLRPSSLVAGDFTGDALPDLAVAGFDTTSRQSELELLLAKGDGKFQSTTPIDLGDLSRVSLITGDLTGNGRTDIVVAGSDASSGQGELEVFLSNGDGTFRATTSIALGSLSPSALVAGDFRGNGRTDIAVAGGAELEVLLGNGDGTFQLTAPISVSTPQPSTLIGPGSPFISSLAAGDFRGDGRTDLVVAVHYEAGTQNVLQVLLSNGDGTFQSTEPFGLVGLLVPDALVTGDFNGDGRTDIAVAGTELRAISNGLEVLLSNGDGTFLPLMTISLGNTIPSSLVAGDFNGDGRTDFAVAGSEFPSQQNEVDLILSNGNDSFQTVTSSLGNLTPSSVVTGDFNGDGRSDIAVIGQEASSLQNELEVLLGNGDGTFQPTTPIAPTGFAAGPAGVTGVVTGDFNGDGRADIAVQAAYEIVVLLGDGDGTFQTTKPNSVDAGAEYRGTLVMGDFRGDGRTDLALVAENFLTDQEEIDVLLGNGDGTFQPPTAINLGGFTGSGTALATGDFTGNGRTDIAVVESSDSSLGQSDVELLASDGDGTFQRSTPITLGGVSQFTFATGDFTGDGRTALALVGGDSSTGQNELEALLANGHGTFQRLPPISLGSLQSGMNPPVYSGVWSPVTGDFNGDRRTDLVVAGSSDFEVLLGKGDGTFQISTPISLGSLIDSPLLATGDFNGDRRTDLVGVSSSGIRVALSLGNGEFADPSAVDSSIRNTPLLADPGDGTEDVFAVNQSGNVLWRKAEPGAPGSFSPSITINPGFASRDITFVSTRQGPLLASVDLQDDAVSLYAYQAGEFVRVGSLATGALPTRIVAGDLNRDGNGDLIVLDAGDGVAAVFLGNGIDGFVRQADVPLSLGVSDIALADIAETGHPDLVVTDQETGLVTVVPGKGDGTFGAPASYPAGAGPYSVSADADGATTVTSNESTAGVAIGTFTQGGIPGLATIDPGTNSLAVLGGLGGGSFANAVRYLTGTPAKAVVAGDFNGDGLSDLAVLGSNGVSIWLNDGASAFHPTATYKVGPDATGLSHADVNHDGKLDLLIGDAEGDVLVLLGNGNGTFRTYRNTNQNEALAVLPTSGPTPEFIFADQGLNTVVVKAGSQSTVLGNQAMGVLDPGAVQLADLNADGIPDLIVANSGGNNVLVYRGLGDGTFGPELNGGSGFFTGTDPVGVTVADVNGDGRPDLIVADKGSNDVAILLNQSTANSGFTFVPEERLKAGLGPSSTVVQYVNGVPNILVSDSGSNQVTMLPGVGNGFFNDQNPRTFAVGSNPNQIMIGDFLTGQGPEILTVNAGSNSVTVISGFDGPSPVFDTFSTGGIEPVAAFAVRIGGQELESLVVANSDGVFALLGGTDGLELEQTFSNRELPEPSALALAEVSGNEVSFYATTAGVETAFTLAFVLPGFAPSTVPVPGSSSATAEAPPVLVSLSETSPALVGTLLISVLTTSTNTTIANLDANQADVSTSFLALSPSQGQSLFTQSRARGSGPGESTEAEVESEPVPTAPPWAQYVLGLDEVFDQILQESQEDLFRDDQPAREETAPQGELGDPFGLLAPEAAMPTARRSPRDLIEAVRPVDRSAADAIDQALEALATPARWPSDDVGTSFEASPGMTLENEPLAPAELAAEPVPFWVPLPVVTMMLVRANLPGVPVAGRIRKDAGRNRLIRRDRRQVWGTDVW